MTRNFTFIALAMALGAAPLAGAIAGQTGRSNAGTSMYSPGPLIVHSDTAQRMAAVQNHVGRPVAREKRVRIADLSAAWPALDQPEQADGQARDYVPFTRGRTAHALQMQAIQNQR